MMRIKAQVPYAEMLDYGVALRAMTQGRGSFNMVFENYEEVPTKVAEAIIEEYNEQNGND